MRWCSVAVTCDFAATQKNAATDATANNHHTYGASSTSKVTAGGVTPNAANMSRKLSSATGMRKASSTVTVAEMAATRVRPKERGWDESFIWGYKVSMKSRQRKLQPSKAYIEALFLAAEYLEDRGELRAAFQCLLAGAEGGDEFSQLSLGNYFSDGTGIRKDLKKAAYWYRKAYNNQGRGVRWSTAALNLAINFRNSGNLKAAMSWFERARALKDGSACLELARIHATRKGGRRKAVILLKEVIELDSDYSTELDKEAAEAMLMSRQMH